MPSQDTFHQERPETNNALLAQLSPSERERLNATAKAVSTRATSPAVKRGAQAARIQALAARLGEDAEELASRIPDDTLRRLKYPVLVQPQEDGTTQFKHDLGVIRGDTRRSLLATDHIHEETEKQARSERGRFVK